MALVLARPERPSNCESWQWQLASVRSVPAPTPTLIQVGRISLPCSASDVCWAVLPVANSLRTALHVVTVMACEHMLERSRVIRQAAACDDGRIRLFRERNGECLCDYFLLWRQEPGVLNTGAVRRRG